MAGASMVDGMQLGEGKVFREGLIRGSNTFGDDSKTTLGVPFRRKIVVRGSGYASLKNGLTRLCKHGVF